MQNGFMELSIDRKQLILLALAVYLVAGFMAAMPRQTANRTQIECICPETGAEEVSCNRIESRDYVFYTWFLNMYLDRDGREFVKCEAGEPVGAVYRFEGRKIGFELFSMTMAEF